jgi:PAS domain S-box-containing protein
MKPTYHDLEKRIGELEYENQILKYKESKEEFTKEIAYATINALPENICILDEIGTIIIVNQSWLDFAESNQLNPPDVSEGVNYLEICDKASGPYSEEAPLFSAGIRSVMNSELNQYDLEYPCHSPNEKRWFIGHVTRFYFDGLVRIVITHENITNRKLAEIALVEAEEKWRQLVITIPDYIALHDLDGRYIFLNHYAEGFSEKDIVGKTLFDFISEESKEEYHHKFDACIQTEQTQQFIYSAFGDNNIFRTYESYLVPIIENEQIVNIMAIARDITVKGLMEEALRESESRYRSVVEDQTEIISRFKSDGTLIFVNEVYCRFFGKTLDELIGQKWIPMAYPEDIEMIQEKLQAMSPDNPVITIENRVFSAKGDLHCMQFINRGFYSLEGILQEIQSVGRDITERKQAEIALLESEERYRLLFEKSLDAVLLTNPNGSIYAANPAACKMFDYTEDELYNSGRQAVVDESDKNFIYALKEREKKGEYRTELTFIRKNGEKFIGEITSVVFKNKDGENRSSMIIRDITERINSEKLLKISERKYRNLHETMMDGFANVDMNGKIIEFNETYRRMLGYSDSELSKMTYEDFTPEKWHIYEKDIVENQILKNGFSEVYHKEYRKKDGTIFPVELRTALIKDEDGNNKGMWAIVRDITKRVKIEHELRKSQEQIREFAANLQSVRENERVNIARELHDEMAQILSAINISLSSLINSLKFDKENFSLNEVLTELDSNHSMVIMAMQRVKKLISDLRLDVLEDFGINEAIKDYIDNFIKRTKIECNFKSNLLNLKLNRIHSISIFRILQEALTNVALHSKASKVKIDFNIKNYIIKLTIIDNGIGFEMDKLDFKSSFGIIGMKERAVLCSGSLEIKSIVGKKTEVRFQMPVID